MEGSSMIDTHEGSYDGIVWVKTHPSAISFHKYKFTRLLNDKIGTIVTFKGNPPPPAMVKSASMTLPTDSNERKTYPVLSGCVKYFPAALAGVAKISKLGNDKHNPGEPLHHARS